MANKLNTDFEIPRLIENDQEEPDWLPPDTSSEKISKKMNQSIPKPAGFWIRLLAFEIDFILLSIGGLGISEIFYYILNYFNKSHIITQFSIAFFAILYFSYFTFFESSLWKATPGKRFLGLRVTTIRGKRIDRIKAFSRTVISFVASLPFFAGFLCSIFTRKKQGLHDLSSNTLVLRKPGESVLPESFIIWESGLIRVSSIVFMMPFVIFIGSTFDNVFSPMLIDHKRRVRVVDAIHSVQPILRAIETGAKIDKKYPVRIDEEVFKSSSDASKSIVVYNPKNGVLTLQFSDPRKDNSAVISLYPVSSAAGEFKWNCSAYGIEDKVLPLDCKSKK